MAESGSGTRKPSNKIRAIVRIHQLVKKWNNRALNELSKENRSGGNASTSTGGGSQREGINKFLKKTMPFSKIIPVDGVPKGCLAVCVGGEAEEKKRFVIPTEFLSQQAFQKLLRAAEEEFGFQQEGVLRIPCPVEIFVKITRNVKNSRPDGINCCSSPDHKLAYSPHYQLCT